MNQQEGAPCRQAEGPNAQESPEPVNRSTGPIARLLRVSASLAILALAAGFGRSLVEGGHTGGALAVILIAAAIIAVVLPIGGRS